MWKFALTFILLIINLDVFFQPLINGAHQNRVGAREMQLQDTSNIAGKNLKHPPVKDDLIVYPNPVKGEEARFSRVIKGEVFNMLGQKVRNITDRNYLDVTDMSNGVYILKTGKGAVHKFIIDK